VSDTVNVEERLRRALKGVAELPGPQQGPSSRPPRDDRRKTAAMRQRRLRLITTTIAVAATAAAVSLLVAYGPSGGAKQSAHIQVPLHHSTTSSSSTASSSLPVSRTTVAPPSSTTVPASTKAPTKAPAPTTTSTNPGPPTTHVEVFSPWTAEGTLSSTVRVSERLSGYNCPIRSSFDVGNPYAWRCFLSSGFTVGGGGGGAFYDPCFAPPGQSEIIQVACGDSPWSEFVIITLKQPLAHSSWGTPKQVRDYAWAMELGNGQRCGVIDGTGSMIDRVIFNYGCSTGYAAYPDTGVEPWTAQYAAGSSGPITSLVVTTAWR
jgi:hypothetical protein